MASIEKAREALKKYFGYEHFRPMQAEIIQAIYDQKDVLVLMPTGGGKSICFQIPAVTMPGVCVVVSPLISLMKDQVEALRANGIPAAFLNSSLSSAEQRHVEDELFHGRLQLLYVSPEKLASPGCAELLKQANVHLFAIDEAHCISSWGHDFRPEYHQLSYLKRQFPGIPVVALTATADKLTRKDIVEKLGLEEPEIFVASFDRPNLSLEVRPGQKRIEQIYEYLQVRPRQSGIIYCLSRKNTEELASKLRAKGFNADCYHAGMDSQNRSRVQEDFINDKLSIVCATVAFGMGIDKSNVRWVIHYNLPKNLEGYYQEIGRAGRDGAKSDTLLFYSFRDVMVLQDILQSDNKAFAEVQKTKLERMRQYAEALICRRKILLAYFGEDRNKNCGNCDVCKDPPQYFDGTVLAQKALSAIYRVQERVGMNLLVDILRGSRRQEILSRGYDKVKTYGAGGDISAYDWQQLIQQMISLGLIEIAYEYNNVLRLTEASQEVLFKGRKVQLVKMRDLKERIKKQKEKAKPVTKRQRVRDDLFEVLRQLRSQIARKEGIPPYIVFSDKTLEEMAAERPTNRQEMLQVSGVGETKMNRFGAKFITAIMQFLISQKNTGTQLKGSTQLITYQMYKRGLPVSQIAQEREMAETTVIGHLVKMYLDGHDVQPSRFVTRGEMQKVYAAVAQLPPAHGLKDIFEALGQKVSYGKIRFALAVREKMGV